MITYFNSAEQSVDRSNALASAQILSMMLAHDEAPDPRPLTDVSAKHDKTAVNAFRYSNESKVVGVYFEKNNSSFE